MSNPNIEVSEFLAADFERRIHLASRAAGRRLWSTELASVWADLLDRVGSLVSVEVVDELLRQRLLLDPYSESFETTYRRLVEDDAGGTPRAAPALVGLLISCRRYLPKARALAEQLRRHFDPLHIVIGNEKERRARVDGEFLVVPAHDDYESLPKKILEALVGVRRIYGPAAVLKLDDDGRFVSPPNTTAIEELLKVAQYAGQVGGGPRGDRCWHVGKCKRIPELPYTKPFVGQWALGPLYLLGDRAVDQLVRTYLRFPGTLAGELYEDKLVGDMLSSQSIALVSADLPSIVGVQTNVEPDPEDARTVTWSGPNV